LVSGYVLINVDKGKALEAAEEVLKVKGVNCACAVTGDYDIIATFEVENIADVGKLVCKGIHSIPSVCCTKTAICAKCCCK